MLRGKSSPEYAEYPSAAVGASLEGTSGSATGSCKAKGAISEACMANLASSSLAARSVEVIPSIATPDDKDGKNINRHKKREYGLAAARRRGFAPAGSACWTSWTLLTFASVAVSHRRSLSEDVGLMVAFPAHTSPSEKARCHFMGAGAASSPAGGTSRITAKHVGESMCREDPHYQPTEEGAERLNPFAALSHFRGVKKILGDKAAAMGTATGDLAANNLACSGDLFSSCFELPSPFFSPTQLSPPFGEGGAAAAPRRASHDSTPLSSTARIYASDTIRRAPRKLSLGPAGGGPPFTVPSADLLGTTAAASARPAAECVPPAVNAGLDMWCKVGSRWRLKSEVEAEQAEAAAGRRTGQTTPECSDSEADAAAGPASVVQQPRPDDGLIQGSIFSPQNRAADDYLKMDCEANERCPGGAGGKTAAKAKQCEGGVPVVVKSVPGDACQGPRCAGPAPLPAAPGGQDGGGDDADVRAAAAQKKSWQHSLSLPSSPTFVRRRAAQCAAAVCTAINPKVLTQRLLETQGGGLGPRPKAPVEEDGVFSGQSSVLDFRPDAKALARLGPLPAPLPLPLQRRLSSSSSNLNSLLLSEDDAIAASGTVLGGLPSVALRRRGSCESGFFSCLGEDYGLLGIILTFDTSTGTMFVLVL